MPPEPGYGTSNLHLDSPRNIGSSDAPRRQGFSRRERHHVLSPGSGSGSRSSAAGNLDALRLAESNPAVAPVSINPMPFHPFDLGDHAFSLTSLHISPSSGRVRTNPAIAARHPRLANRSVGASQSPTQPQQYNKPPPKPGPVYMSLQGQELRDYAAARLNNFDQLAAWARDQDKTVPAARSHFERIMLGATPSASEGQAWTDEVGVDWDDRSEVRKKNTAKQKRRLARKSSDKVSLLQPELGESEHGQPTGKQFQPPRDETGWQRTKADGNDRRVEANSQRRGGEGASER